MRTASEAPSSQAKGGKSKRMRKKLSAPDSSRPFKQKDLKQTKEQQTPPSLEKEIVQTKQLLRAPTLKKETLANQTLDKEIKLMKALMGNVVDQNDFPVYQGEVDDQVRPTMCHQIH